MHVAWEVVAVGVVNILARDLENHHVFVGSVDVEAPEEGELSFVVPYHQLEPHGQTAAALCSGDTELLGIEVDLAPIAHNYLLIHSTERQESRGLVVLAFAEAFENYCSAMVLRD